MHRLDSMTIAVMLGIAAFLGWSLPASAEVVTFTGTVSYSGPYTGDTLYVAVIDTTQTGEDVTFLDLEAYEVGSPPFDQAYSLSFDNATAPAEVLIAALLDVDGGGVDSVGGADIIGWYAGTSEAVGVSSATSQSGLDFDMPEAEIHGTITFAPGQQNATLVVATSCTGEGFSRPSIEITSSGTYAVKGIYAGTYCVFAFGFVPPFTFAGVCFGDPTCANPTLITLAADEVRTGIDLDFSGNVPAPNATWGGLKSRYK